MNKNRLEAFTDAILAIIMTIMVLEIHIPEGFTPEALAHEWIPLVAFIISFLGMANLWYFHHAVFQNAKVINRSIFWANMTLLLWIALVPVATAWVAEYPNKAFPEFIYLLVQFGWSLLLGILILVTQHYNPEIAAKRWAKQSTTNWIYSTIILFVGMLVTFFWPFAGIITGIVIVLYLILLPITGK